MISKSIREKGKRGKVGGKDQKKPKGSEGFDRTGRKSGVGRLS